MTLDPERGAPPYGASFKVLLLLFLATLSIDAGRKTIGLPSGTLGIIYILTGITYIIFVVRAGPRSHVAPRSLPLWLTGLSLWCIADAAIQRIPFMMALLGSVSYVFFVPLLYVAAELMADDERAAKALRIAAVAGGIVGFGAITSAIMGNSAPSILLPIIPSVGFHTFSEGNVYLAPSIFATGEEAAEQLLIALFVWIALAHIPPARMSRKLSIALGVLIVGGIIATVRRTDILVAAAGISTLLIIGQLYPITPPGPLIHKNSRGKHHRLGPALFLAVVGSAALISFLGANRLIPFLFSGGPTSRVSLMFSLNNSSSILGQGTGTSTQGGSLVGAIPFYGANSNGQYTAYLLNGRTFITAEGGLAKTWIELGWPGLILYGGVFLSALATIVWSFRSLDGAGRALTVLSLSLGVVFLKGHQDLDNPLIQPLFWLGVGGAWGRMRALAAPHTESNRRLPKRLANPYRGNTISRPPTDAI